MRFAAIVFVVGLATAGADTAQADYYCSPGFQASYGGLCVATLARDEVDLYLNEPAAELQGPVVRHHRPRRRGLAARY